MVFIAAALLVLTAGGIWFFLSGDHDEDGLQDMESRASTTDESDAGTPSPPPSKTIDPPPVQREAVTPPSNGKAATVFSGRAVDTATGAPVTDYVLSLRRLKKSDGTLLQPYPPWRRESIASRQGRFSIPLDAGGTYVIRFEAAGYQRPDHRQIEISDGEELGGYLLELTPGLIMTGRVVEDATSAPLAGAEVVPFIIRSIQKQGHANTWADGEPSPSGNDGCFTVTGLKEGAHRLWARHPDFAESFADGDPGGAAVEIRLRPGHRFHGLVRDAKGRPAPGVNVHFYSLTISAGRNIQTGVDGRYATPILPSGSYSLDVLPGEDGKVMREMQHAELSDRDVEVNFGPRPGQVVWRGALIDGQGNAVAAAKLTLSPRFSSRNRQDGTRTVLCSADTNEHGNFEIGPLDTGKYDVDIQFAENTLMSAYYTVSQIEFEQPGLILRDLYLRRTELSGVVIEESTGAPLRNSGGFVMACEGRGKIFTTSINPEGRFRFPCIPPGTYFLSANGLDGSQGRLGNIVLEDDSVISDLRIVLPSGDVQPPR